MFHKVCSQPHSGLTGFAVIYIKQLNEKKLDSCPFKKFDSIASSQQIERDWELSGTEQALNH